MIQHYEENTRGRDFVIGDLHGCVTELFRKMDAKNFDQATDRIFSTGDLVDRGPESERILEIIYEPWFRAVRGNHDQAAIDWAIGAQTDSAWYAKIGGAWMIGKTKHDQMDYAIAFEMLPIALTVDVGNGKQVGIVHADCPYSDWREFARRMFTFNEQPKLTRAAIRETAMWSRERIDHLRDDGVTGIHAMIVGHTPQERVTSLGNVYYVDTGCGKSGKLSMKNIKKLVGA